MKKNFIVHLSFLILFLCLSGCSEDEPLAHNLKVSSVRLIDCPKDTQKNVFECVKEDDSYKCSVTTNYIRKEQSIADLNASYVGRELSVHITLDKDMFPMPLDRMTKVEFVLGDLPKGIYDIDIMIDNGLLTLSPSVWNFD